MNILERPCAWNLNGSPNRRLDLAEPNVQFEESETHELESIALSAV